MDAVEFLRDFRRMCSSYGGTCTGCKLAGTLGTPCVPTNSDCDHEKLIRVVEKMGERTPCENTVVGVFEAVSQCISTSRRLSGLLCNRV